MKNAFEFFRVTSRSSAMIRSRSWGGWKQKSKPGWKKSMLRDLAIVSVAVLLNSASVGAEETGEWTVTDPPSTKAAIPGSVSQSKTFVVYFDFDDAGLNPERIAEIAAACNYAAGLPSATFTISGHTDRVGTESYNEALAEQRAKAVSAAVASDKRFRNSLDVIEFGESKPAVWTEDERKEPRNRRVEITVFPKTEELSDHQSVPDTASGELSGEVTSLIDLDEVSTPGVESPGTGIYRKPTM